MRRTITNDLRPLLVALVLGLAVPADAEPWRRHVIDDSSRGADGVRLADFNGDRRADIVTGWEEGGVVRVYLQPPRTGLRGKWPAVTVGPAKNVEDAVAVDLDQDGNLDVVSSCEGRTRTMYVHWGPPKEELLHPDAWVTQAIPASEGAQQWMYCLPMQIDGKHGPDLVAGSKGNGAAVGWWEVPERARDLERWKYHRLIDAGWIMSLVAMDMDGDRDQDVLITDRRGKTRGLKWIERAGKTPEQRRALQKYGEHFGKTHVLGLTDKEVMFLARGDLVGYGGQDIVVTTRNKTIDIFRHKKGQQPPWLHAASIPLPFGLVHGKSVAIGDFNNDGRTDLVTTNRGPPKQPMVALHEWKDSPYGTWAASDLGGPDGSKFDLLAPLDLDGDGDLDLITCEEVENLGVLWYENPTREPN